MKAAAGVMSRDILSGRRFIRRTRASQGFIGSVIALER
jgi:hypothetical protein